MGRLLDSNEYKTMEEIVLGELQMSMLRIKVDDREHPLYSKCSERELALEGMGDFFNNFIDKFPGWPVNGKLWGDLRKAGIDFVAERKYEFRLRKRVKELINEVGLNKVKIEGLVENFHKSFNKEDYLNFIDYVFPIYIALRIEGYKHYPDLIG